jgi:hypothetical protein
MPQIGISTVIIWHLQTHRLTQPRPNEYNANEPDAIVQCAIDLYNGNKGC